MKKLKNIIICIILSFIVQFLFLNHLERNFFIESENISIKNIDISEKIIDENATIPCEAKNIQISDSGKYIMYFLDNSLMLLNTQNAETMSILQNRNILNVKWVPNNNTLYIVENVSGEIFVKTYNANNNIENEVCDLGTYKKNDLVNCYISISSQYIEVNNGDEGHIYRVDINDEVKKLPINISKLNSASTSWKNDKFVYQDYENKKINVYTNKKNHNIPFKNKNNLCILDTIDKVIYIGEYDENKKISKIVYGEDHNDISKWQTIVLPEPKESKDIFISASNQIYVVYAATNSIKNINSGEIISYEGKFVSMNNKFIFSLDNESVCLKKYI